MKKLALLGLVFWGAIQAYPEATYPEMSYEFTIVQSQMAKRFDIACSEFGPVTLWKRAVDAPTHYDIYDRDGQWNGEAIACFFCMSLLYEWGIEIEIFNKEDMRIGFIEGHSDGVAAARLDLYNARDQLVGIAYLSNKCDEIVVRAPNGGGPIAILERISSNSGSDSWKVSVADRRKMEPRLLQVLAAWAIDRQDAFLRYEH